VINPVRRNNGLPVLRNIEETFSPDCQISQFPRELDFARANEIKTLIQAKPFDRTQSSGRSELLAALDDSKPLVYVSMGTLLWRSNVLKAAADACAELGAQCVISLGGVRSRVEFREDVPHALVLETAPQMELLDRASVFVTHGGGNSTLDAAQRGVPMLVVPGLLDQYCIAHRVEQNGLGLHASESDVASGKLKEKLATLLSDSEYRVRGKAFAERLAEKPWGAEIFADRLETVFGKPHAGTRSQPEPVAVKLSDGIRLQGLIHRAKPDRNTCVVLHGYGVDCTSLRGVSEAIRDSGNSVFAVDLRGHGLSGGTVFGRTPDAFAADLKEACIKLGISRPTIVANSYGSWIGLSLLALQDSDFRVRHLHAIAPPFSGRRYRVAGVARDIAETMKHIAKVLVGAQFPQRQPGRRDYTKYAGCSDYDLRIFTDCARWTGSLAYAWMSCWLAWSRITGEGRWAKYRDLPVTVYQATLDHLVYPPGLVRAADDAGWKRIEFESRHCSLGFEPEHSDNLVAVLIPEILADLAGE
jgi:pimeloyl-ACP methyl ester carboxylesterase